MNKQNTLADMYERKRETESNEWTSESKKVANKYLNALYVLHLRLK